MLAHCLRRCPILANSGSMLRVCPGADSGMSTANVIMQAHVGSVLRRRQR